MRSMRSKETTRVAEQSLLALALVAASLGFTHTLIGPDHYVPFIAMSRVGGWSVRKTLGVSLLCGIGHVGSSVLLGVAGAALLKKVEVFIGIEAFRGQIAAWLLLAFGFCYMIWGIRRAWRGETHTHVHAHADGTVHSHAHDHHANHVHAHAESRDARLTPWILFVIFVFGPCEPLIPILMYPALQQGWIDMMIVAAVFGVATIGTMMTVVILGVVGLRAMRLDGLGRYAHALSGFAVFACGGAMLLGL
jgi:ABC-type nickel/cobalt efflux system permease component RcnA